MMNKKIWIVEADNNECWSEPIILENAKDAEEYVRREYEAACLAMAQSKNVFDEWLIVNGTGIASISNGMGDYYNWRITEYTISLNDCDNAKITLAVKL